MTETTSPSATASRSSESTALSAAAKQALERQGLEVVALLEILEGRNAELHEEVVRLSRALERIHEEQMERLKEELVQRTNADSDAESSRIRELEAQNTKLREQLDKEHQDEIIRLREENQRLRDLENSGLRTQVEHLDSKVQELSAADQIAASGQVEGYSGRRRELAPVYLTEVFVEIDHQLGEVDRCELLGRHDEAANILFVVGHKACETLWKLCDDAVFYEKLTALSQFSKSDVQEAQALLKDDRKFERFLEKLLELLQVAGMDQGRARDLVTQCRTDFNSRQDHTPLPPHVYRAHLRRLRDATCDVAKGELVQKVKRLERHARYKSAAFATGASGIKTIAATAGSTLGPVGTAASSLLADAAVDAASAALNINR